jgi:signal transduction histidine kinase
MTAASPGLAAPRGGLPPLPVHTTEADFRHPIGCELADLLYVSPWSVATNLLVTLVAIAVLSITFQTLAFLGWGVSIVGICIIRIFLWRAYHRSRAALDFEPMIWIRRFTYFAAATGCQWGSLATVAALMAHAPIEIFVPIIIAGLAGGVASGYTAHVPVVDAFIWPVVLPLIVVTMVAGDIQHLAMGGLYLVFVLNLSLMARQSYRTLLRMLKAKMEKERLVAGLDEANRRAEAALRAKSEFLANMSHELRTPLNAVIGFSEIIANEILGPIGNSKYLEYANDLNASGQHLLQLINDILDLTKVSAGRLELADETIDVAELIDSCVRMTAHRASVHGLTLTQSVAADVHGVQGDERRLRQILLNLLSNSIKFTPSGGAVSIRAAIEQGQLMIEVRDTGIGIASEDMARALEPFGQVNNAYNRSGGGTGLGLPLTKKLVELHDGRFTIDSRPGKGTATQITLPPQRVIPARRAAGNLTAA